MCPRYGGGVVFGAVSAEALEEWNGSDLVIHGQTDAGSYVKRLGDGETLTASRIWLGTEQGSATLVATGATISVSGEFHVGHEASPGYDDLTARLEVTDTALTCSTLYLGYDVRGSAGERNGNERIQAVLGPDSVATVQCVKTFATPWGRLRFQGGRLSFAASSQPLFCAEGHTWSGGWPNQGHTVMADGAPIDLEIATDRRLAGGWAVRGVYLEGTGGLVKRGAGTLIWGWHTYGSNNGIVNGTATYEGDTVVKAGGIRLATPSSEEKKQVRFSIPPKSPLVVEEGAFFDFAGNDAAWVSVSGAGLVTNSAERACTVTVGTGDVDCRFTPVHVGGPLNVEKVGAGTLTLASLDLAGTLTVSSGTAVVPAGSTLTAARIVVAAGATLDFRGARLACAAFDAANGARVLRDASSAFDATLDVQAEADETRIGGMWAADGILRKTGAGTLTLFGACAKPSGAVVVAEGTLAVEPAAAFAGKYIRFNYRKSATMKNLCIALSEFSLYGVDGTRLNGEVSRYTPLEVATTQQYGGFGGIDDATQLAENEVAVWMPKHDGYFQLENPNAPQAPLYLFDGNPATALVNTYYWDDSNWLVFRLPETVADAVGFTFTTAKDPGVRPTEWRVDGSVDGVTWAPLARHEYGTDSDAAWDWRTNSTPNTACTEYNGGAPYPFDQLEVDPSGVAFGAASVSVAAGATLDLRSEKMRLGHLAVDIDAGAGTITRFTPEPNGALDLVAADATCVRAGFVVPLTVGNLPEADALSTWTVYVNGVEKRNLGLRFANGKLVLYGRQFIVIIR